MRLPAKTRRWGLDRGAAVAEFALVLPFLVMIMLGTITAGIALNNDLQLHHSARDAARYGATVPEGQTFVSGNWAANVRSVALSRFGSGLDESDVCVALVSGIDPTPVSSNHTTEANDAACYDDSAAGISDTRVQVSVSMPAKLETGLFTADITLSADAVSMHESNA